MSEQEKHVLNFLKEGFDRRVEALEAIENVVQRLSNGHFIEPIWGMKPLCNNKIQKKARLSLRKLVNSIRSGKNQGQTASDTLS